MGCLAVRQARKPVALTQADAAADDGFAHVHSDVLNSLSQCEGKDFLAVPDAIRFGDGQAVRRLAQNMVSNIATHDSKVFISYATGHRTGDAEGFGPGTYFATAVLKAFHDAGIQCFSGLMIPTGMNWEIFCAQLSGRFTTCKILIVLQTKALYSSKPCLKEIYAAQRSKIGIIPVRFECDLPPIEEQWLQIKKTNLDEFLMLTEVQNEFCQLEAIPEVPKTVLSDASVLDDLVADVRERLSDPSGVVRGQPKMRRHVKEEEESNLRPVLSETSKLMTTSADTWKITSFLRRLGSGGTQSSPLEKPQREAKFRKERRQEAESQPGHCEFDFTKPVPILANPTSKEDPSQAESPPIAPDAVKDANDDSKPKVMPRKRPSNPIFEAPIAQIDSPGRQLHSPRAKDMPTKKPNVAPLEAPASPNESPRLQVKSLEPVLETGTSQGESLEPPLVPPAGNAELVEQPHQDPTEQSQKPKVVGRKRPKNRYSPPLTTDQVLEVCAENATAPPAVGVAPDLASRRGKKPHRKSLSAPPKAREGFDF